MRDSFSVYWDVHLLPDPVLILGVTRAVVLIVVVGDLSSAPSSPMYLGSPLRFDLRMADIHRIENFIADH
jgi:hypothetical protein